MICQTDHSDVSRALQDSQRREQLLSILDLLRYAEVEIAELDLGISTVLLGAAIADVAGNLKQYANGSDFHH